MRTLILTFHIAVSFVLLAPGSLAQVSTFRPSLRAYGTARVWAKPDQARISFSISSTEANLQTATEAATAKANELIAQMKQAFGNRVEARLTALAVSSSLRIPLLPQERGVGVNVEVALSDLSGVGKLLDLIIAANPTQISGVSYAIRDTTQLRLQGLREATQNARAQADAMAAGLGARTGRVIQLVESYSPSSVVSGSSVPEYSLLLLGARVPAISSSPQASGNTPQAVNAPNLFDPSPLDLQVTVSLEMELVQ